MINDLISLKPFVLTRLWERWEWDQDEAWRQRRDQLRVARCSMCYFRKNTSSTSQIKCPWEKKEITDPHFILKIRSFCGCLLLKCELERSLIASWHDASWLKSNDTIKSLFLWVMSAKCARLALCANFPPFLSIYTPDITFMMAVSHKNVIRIILQ